MISQQLNITKSFVSSLLIIYIIEKELSIN